MALPDLDRLLPELPEGQRNPPLRARSVAPRNVESFGSAVRKLREELAGTDVGADMDHELESRGLLKDSQLQGRAAQD